jgi:uncharacterized membrane protein YczE
LQLYGGLILFGASTALMMRAGLGLKPWDVLHHGVSRQTDWSLGTVVIASGAVLLLLWIPLRQRPGIGTVSNVVVIGLVVDAILQLVPALHGVSRYPVLVSAVALNGVATAAYLGAGLGPGPRDGLMIGIASTTGWPLGPVRTGIELGVLGAGWLLGGSVGLGTLVYALAIGPIVHRMLPFFTSSPVTESELRPS